MRFRPILIFFLLSCRVNFSLAQQEPESLELAPIVVKRSFSPAPFSYSFAKDEALWWPSDFFLKALQLPGLDFQSRSPVSLVQADFSLRGSNFQGVGLFLDGMPVNDPQTGHHNCDLPFTWQDIQQVNVIYNSALPGALAGALDFRLNRPKEKRFFYEGSFDNFQTKSFLLSLSEEKNDLGLRFSLEDAESAGFYPGTDFKKLTASLTTALDTTSSMWDLFLGYQEKEFGAYDFYTPAKGFFSLEWTKTFLLKLGAKSGIGELTVEPQVLWRRHWDKFMLDRTQLRSSYLNHHQTDVVTPNLYFSQEFINWGKLGVGLGWSREYIDSTNLGQHQRLTNSLALDYSKGLSDDFIFEANFREDKIIDGRGYSSGSLSLAYEIFKGQRISLGISRNIRQPSFTELYYSDPTTVGNADLIAERAICYQLQYILDKGCKAVRSTIFFRSEDDTIDWVKHTQLQPRWQAENLAGVRIWGWENSFHLKLNSFLNLQGGYSYNNRFTSCKGWVYKYGLNYSRHLVNIGFIFDLPFGQQSLVFTYRKKPHRRGWLVGNLRLCRRLGRNVETFFEVDNLFNVEYQDIEGIPQPQRRLAAGLRWQW